MLADRRLLLGSVAALVAATLFGMLGPLSRWAEAAGVAALAFVAWRAGTGALALAVGIGATGGLRRSLGSVGALDGRGRASLAVAIVMGFTLNLAIFVAFGRITIALALMLFYTYPAMVAAVGVALGHERLTPPRALALALATVGVVLVLVGSLDPGGGVAVDPLGVALGLAAAASQTVFMTISRHGYSAVAAETATMLILAGSFAGGLLVAAVAGLLPELAEPLRSTASWPPILVAGILGAAVPSLLFLTAIRSIGATRTGILMLWEPVVGVALAAILLSETLVPVQVVGGGLVLGAALLLQLVSEPETEPVAPAIDLV
jgi:drug/metabolite transporter (DMT)-like permease